MQWKGRPQSKNVQDDTYGPPIQIKSGDILLGGEPYDTNNSPDINKPNQIPQQAPGFKNGITSTQVTPGVWKTKNSI